MPRSGEVWGAGFGDTKSKVLYIRADLLTGNVVRVRILPSGKFRGRTHALFNSGQFFDTLFTDIQAEAVRAVTLPIGTEVGSLEVVEVGSWGRLLADDVGQDWIGGWVEELEAADAMRLRVQWDSEPALFVDPAGTISSPVIAGVVRFSNVAPVPKFPSRAILGCTIHDVSGTRVMRLFNDQVLVAEGSRIGDGLILCDSRNDSGLTFDAVVTYTGDVLDGTVILRWTGSWNLHYDHDPLIFPRTAEDTVLDLGENYSWLSPNQAQGNVYYAVQAVGDDGIVETSPTPPSDSPKVINTQPEPVPLAWFSGNYAAITVHWTLSPTPNCRYTVYSSLVDEPVNLGQWAAPGDIGTGENETVAVIPPVANWTPNDWTSAYNGLVAALDAWAAGCNADFGTKATYGANMLLRKAECQAALQAFADALQMNIDPFAESMAQCHDWVIATDATNVDAPLDAWQDRVGFWHGLLLDQASVNLDGQRGGYLMPNGSLPMTVLASSASPTGEGTLGSGAIATPERTLSDLAWPRVQNRIVRVVIRATDPLGNQENYDNVWEVELDSNGDVVVPRPNMPSIESITASGLSLSVAALYQSEDEGVAPTRLQLWVVPSGTTMNPASPSAYGTLVSQLGGTWRATVAKSGLSTGYWDVAVAAYDPVTGGQSLLTDAVTVYVTNIQPGVAQNVSAKVIRAE